MALEIYWGSGSGPAWRVLLALKIKNVPFESKLLSFSNRDHKAEGFLALNPRGKVPALRDGDYVVYESLAILTYLDRKHPTPPLFGTTPEAAGTIMRVIMEHECYGGPAIAAFVRPLMLGTVDDAKLEASREALPAVRDELGRLEAQLGHASWLAGAELSAADVFVFPMWKTLERALTKPGAARFEHGLAPLAAHCPRLAAWARRIEALPGYEATYPPHWREG